MQTQLLSSSSITNFISKLPSAHYACLSARCFEPKCRYTLLHTRTHSHWHTQRHIETVAFSDLLASFSNFIFNWLSTRARSQCWLTNSNWAFETSKKKKEEKEKKNEGRKPSQKFHTRTHIYRERYKRQKNPFLSFCSLL